MLLSTSRPYRRLLKKLKTACDTRPHFVQELRFVLSLPLVECRPQRRDGDPVGVAESSAQQQHLQRRHRSCDGAALLRDHLHRPPSEMMTVDSETMFQTCRQDLRLALETGGLLSQKDAAAGLQKGAEVAQLIAAQQELAWLSSYLDKMLHRETGEALAEMLAVNEGSLEDISTDFIPDSFFAEAAEPESPAALEGNGDRDRENHVMRGSDTAQSNAPADKNHPLAEQVLHSAGAVGLHREMVCAHAEEALFPLVEWFLRSASTLDKQKLRKLSRNHHMELADYVKEFIPRRTLVRNEDLEGVAELSVFDSAGNPPLSPHPKAYLLAVTLTPLNRARRVQLVNTYFVRYSTARWRMYSDVGMMPADAVKRLLQERDWSQEERRKLWDDRRASLVQDGTVGAEKQQDGEAVGTPSGTSAVDNSYRFQLIFFTPPSDPQHVLKGLLYYKVGAAEELLHEPIKAISLGQLLLAPE